jgi:GT2 family glycosyltransferase
MAVFDEEGSGRTGLTERTFQSLLDTVDFRRHRIFVIDNASCNDTQMVIMEFGKLVDDIQFGNFTLIANRENIGTAKAINQGWKERKPGENCIKIDNDVVINSANWIEEMQDAILRNAKIGIIGLKRKDLMECTSYPDPNFRSVLIQLPHKPGERWVIIEQARGIMGTCQMVSAALLDRIGYLHQPSKYGFDDSLFSRRSELAGFINCFLPHIDIDHIDPGGTEYTEWKRQAAAEFMGAAQQLNADYISGKRPIYEEP